MSKDKYFVPENANLRHQREYPSPSGKYKLVVTPYQTKEGCWNYTQGLVYESGSEDPLFEVRRNYSSFPFEWIEDHPNGHSYLICGEDYQGQTVLELDTEKRRDHLPKEANEGIGFCWASYNFHRESCILVVEGCYWACPYQFKFYDFSDPMSGWPEIGGDLCIDTDKRPPTINPDGTIICYQTEDEDYDDDSDEEGEEKLPPVAAWTSYRREGLKLIKLEEWVSEKEQTRRREQEEARRKWDEWYSNFKATDPLYLRVTELCKDSRLSPAEYNGIGTTYKDWCPGFDKQETRICRDVVREPTWNICVEWGAITGPVKVTAYKNHNRLEDKFFMEHSVASIDAAFEYIHSLLAGE